VLRRHAELLVEVFGPDRGAREVRKHAVWYLAGYPVGGEVRGALSQVSSLAEVHAHLDALDPDLALRPGNERVVRGHTRGPRPVAVPEGWFDRVDDPTPPGIEAEALTSGG
jgi:hypothetical protein